MGGQECFRDPALLSVFSSMRVPPAGLAEHAVWPGDGTVLLPPGGGWPALQPLPAWVLWIPSLPSLPLQWACGAVRPSERRVPQLPRVHRWKPLWKVSPWAGLQSSPRHWCSPKCLCSWGHTNASMTLTGNTYLNQDETGPSCCMSGTYFSGKCMWECACNAVGGLQAGHAPSTAAGSLQEGIWDMGAVVPCAWRHAQSTACGINWLLPGFKLPALKFKIQHAASQEANLVLNTHFNTCNYL